MVDPSTGTEPGGKCGRWSVGHDAPKQTALWQLPARRAEGGVSGRSLTAATEHTMAFKWTKASRAKLSTSQNGSSVGSALSVPPANIAGISSERGRRTTAAPALGAFFPPFDPRRGQS